MCRAGARHQSARAHATYRDGGCKVAAREDVNHGAACERVVQAARAVRGEGAARGDARVRVHSEHVNERVVDLRACQGSHLQRAVIRGEVHLVHPHTKRTGLRGARRPISTKSCGRGGAGCYSCTSPARRPTHATHARTRGERRDTTRRVREIGCTRPPRVDMRGGFALVCVCVCARGTLRGRDAIVRRASAARQPIGARRRVPRARPAQQVRHAGNCCAASVHAIAYAAHAQLRLPRGVERARE